MTLDTTGDGRVDTYQYDTTGDGRIDTIYRDTTGDGQVDVAEYDTTGDGRVNKRVRARATALSRAQSGIASPCDCGIPPILQTTEGPLRM